MEIERIWMPKGGGGACAPRVHPLNPPMIYTISTEVIDLREFHPIVKVQEDSVKYVKYVVK